MRRDDSAFHKSRLAEKTRSKGRKTMNNGNGTADRAVKAVDEKGESRRRSGHESAKGEAKRAQKDVKGGTPQTTEWERGQSLRTES